MPTFYSLFSGFGLADEGAKAAGYDLLGGVEYDPRIAEVARANGHAVTVARVEESDPRQVPQRPDVLWASPVCKNASAAKTGGVEDGGDSAMARGICNYIEVLQPPVFMLENVWGYRKFESFHRICATLNRLGYLYSYEHLNAADYGVPQSRKRLILRAVRDRGFLPPLPPKQAHRGWYQAIEDLIPSLPESRFADWQLKRLPALFADVLVDCKNNNKFGESYREREVPAMTLMTTHPPRAFIVHPTDQRTMPVRVAKEPVWTQTTNESGNYARAWLDGGRVVAMSVRALARFQTLPDSYILPDSPSLACTGIGNGVACLLAETLLRQMKELF